MSFEGSAISLAASLVSVGFAGLVLNQYLGRRRPYQLAWSVGLGMYGVAAFTQFLAEAYQWSVELYKVYYLIAASLVAVLGTGSTFLVRRRLGLAFAAYTAILFAGFAVAVAGAQVDLAALQSPIPAGAAMPGNVRLFSPLFTVPGSVALIGIAAYSYWRTRLVCNAWIGFGAAVVAAGGTLARFDLPWLLYVAELVGIALMFWGFLESQDLVKAERKAPATGPAT